MQKSIGLQGIINFDSGLINRSKIGMKTLKEIWGSRFDAAKLPRKTNLFYRKKSTKFPKLTIAVVGLSLCAVGLLSAFK